ncbi:transcription elongation factor Elf1 [Litorivivens lipolytica]|uniref:Transcription elongation factor Elf1 n=1 Tax=Litorivivens lipolytica TaxID=1524264 RepID=A0A7W4W7Y2_9GAMM|nr:transcription elongation factor Elf1 [Litorivivens lipolytica]
MEIRVSSYTAVVDCPHCGCGNSNWVMDPRGAEAECDNCEKKFTVPENASITLT